jgi:hypothetical protein
MGDAGSVPNAPATVKEALTLVYTRTGQKVALGGQHLGRRGLSFVGKGPNCAVRSGVSFDCDGGTRRGYSLD